MIKKEYIERNSLINNLKRFAPKHYTDLINNLIIKQPVENVKPVIYAKWIDNGISESMLYTCSNCEFSCGAYSFNYCPNCSAKMMDKE